MDTANTTRAIAIPILTLGVGFILPFLTPQNSGDWLGMGIILIWLGAIVVAGISAVGFSIAAFRNEEPRAHLSLITAAPAALFLLWLICNLGNI